MKLDVFLAEDDPLLNIDVAVVRCNINCLVGSVRKELLKKAAMNYPRLKELKE